LILNNALNTDFLPRNIDLFDTAGSVAQQRQVEAPAFRPVKQDFVKEGL
jgi:hypothetical protein